MDSAYRIKETLYIETKNNTIFPLIPAGRRVPVEWEQTFTTNKESQSSIDFHLLRGVSDKHFEGTTVGKWRLAGIPPAPKGDHLVRVKIHIGVDGTVWLKGIIKSQQLVVTMLTETTPKIPLTIRVPEFQYEKLVQTTCWSCKSRFVIGIMNWKDEPFALCLDCGNELALPETLKTSATAPWEDLPPELLRAMGIEMPHQPGGLPPDELQDLKDKGYDLEPEEEKDLTINASKVIEQFSAAFFGKQKKSVELDYDDIVRLAGDPIPEDQRRKCPNCDAVIALDAIRCEWCGKNI